jgi:hypothetical protein
MGNDLGLVPKMVREVRRSLSRTDSDRSAADARLGKILAQVQKVLDLSRDLSPEVTRGAPCV